MKPLDPLLAFRWIYVVFIIYASAKTLWDSLASPGITMLASAEILAAIFFLFKRTERPARGALLIIFAVAGTLTLLQGELPLRFVYYGATAMFIVACRRPFTNASTDLRASNQAPGHAE